MIMKIYNEPITDVLTLSVTTRLMDGVAGSPGTNLDGDDITGQGGSTFAPRHSI